MISDRAQRPKFRPPGPRDALLKIHRDLLLVDRHVIPLHTWDRAALTRLEKHVLVLEDRRYLSHWGVDLVSVLREVLKAVTFRRHGGASTIDMQFVRTATGYRSRTLRRKLYEILLSLLIQFRYSKTVILRSYLSCAFFGSRLYGAEAAAIKMFDKPTVLLTDEECAMLASMLVYPRPIDPDESWMSRIQRRARYGQRTYVAHEQRFE
jgi:membrane carboxypeptidase/penicillin-binding protein